MMNEIVVKGTNFRVGGLKESGVITVDFSNVYRMCSDICSMIQATRSSDLVFNKMIALEREKMERKKDEKIVATFNRSLIQ